ncbi:YdcF family protein [Cryobacterium sp. 1639]|uniref:YdcF family protein n=1 Tax=Cryobacterium inferilacus TaxID=2866629 RepID=UPI001C73D064|nr:YdcF family protein [Cryobacterium sp. 1639]MBX0301318.1 YdcF family protein [Cryobacterium sp. 1639]
MPSADRPRRRTRRMRRTVVVCATVCAILGAVALQVLVFPPLDEPDPVDVIVVLGRPVPERVNVAEDLMAHKLGATLLISVDDYGIDDASNVVPCRQSRPYPVICEVPDPFTTQGEARMLGRLAIEHGWRSALVVTSTYHAARARLLFGRCFDGRLLVVSDGAGLSLFEGGRQLLYQSAALAKAVWTPGC